MVKNKEKPPEREKAKISGVDVQIIQLHEGPYVILGLRLPLLVVAHADRNTTILRAVSVIEAVFEQARKSKEEQEYLEEIGVLIPGNPIPVPVIGFSESVNNNVALRNSRLYIDWKDTKGIKVPDYILIPWLIRMTGESGDVFDGLIESLHNASEGM